MTQINCKNITIGYQGVIAASDLSFSIEEKDYICIIGDNGTGKTTLLKVLLGLKKPSSGKIELLNGLKRNQIGYLAQQTEIQRDFPASVMEVTLSGCLNSPKISPFYSSTDKKRAINALGTLGITELKNRCYKELSGGQQQRVLLARALCATEKILVLDEPTTGLDPSMTTELFSFVKKLNEEQGTSIIMVTHDTHCAVKFSKHILHLTKDSYFYGTKDEYLLSELGSKYVGGHRHD